MAVRWCVDGDELFSGVVYDYMGSGEYSRAYVVDGMIVDGDDDEFDERAGWRPSIRGC